MNSDQRKNEKKVFIGLISACVLTYLIGWQIPLMEIDAVQYANISREMLLHKNFFQIYDQGRDYLDKPPMLFWLSSASMKLFGVNDAAYRLPSFFFSILSIYSVYRFSRLFYAEKVALLNALVLAGSQAMFLINHDTRTDTMLMGWVIFSIWQLAAWLQTKKWTNLILGAVAIAGGMLTKGPIALMVPIFAFSTHFILTRSFAAFFRWEWFLLLLIIGILLMPMNIGLYRQYDLHPEKVMYGKKGISGIRFFYWTQSFGRITGESTWRENSSFLFLFENLLWGFLPWTIFFLLGLATGIRQWVRNKFFVRNGEEAISLGGFGVTYCALASSKAQLPHYIYIVLPLASIITGKFLFRLFYNRNYKGWLAPLSKVHGLLFSLLLIALFLLITVPFPPLQPAIIISAGLMTILFLLIWLQKSNPLPKLLTGCVLIIIFINCWLDVGFYPKLLQFQMSIPVSRFIQDNHLDKDKIFLYQLEPSRSLDFYSNHSFQNTDDPDTLHQQNFLLTSQKGIDMINRTHFKVIDSGFAFHVSRLSLPLLDSAKRRVNSDAYYILERF